MTRKEMILQKVNGLEQKIKKAVQSGDDALITAAIKEQNGYVSAIVDLGYRLVQDDDKAEYLAEKGYWIYSYKDVIDVR